MAMAAAAVTLLTCEMAGRILSWLARLICLPIINELLTNFHGQIYADAQTHIYAPS